MLVGKLLAKRTDGTGNLLNVGKERVQVVIGNVAVQVVEEFIQLAIRLRFAIRLRCWLGRFG